MIDKTRCGSGLIYIWGEMPRHGVMVQDKHSGMELHAMA
jgi:hypothetical protein